MLAYHCEQSTLNKTSQTLTATPTANFWSSTLGLKQASIIDAASQLTISYTELNQQVEALIKRLPAKRQLVALIANNDVDFLVAYLALLRAKHVVLLLEKNNDLMSAQNQHLLEQYQVNYLIEQQAITQLHQGLIKLHPTLALLLSTSGSTGSAKLVKLSYQNLSTNTQAICQYLPIKSTDCMVTTLPLHYSFGLSLLHTHLAVGASIVLTNATPLDKTLWQLYKVHQPSAFYGVPFSFDLLTKLNLERLPLSSVKYMAQAGGKLSPATCHTVNNWCQKYHKQLYLMYGQTEATARIAYLSPDKVSEKFNYIGQAIPNGQLAIRTKNNKIVTEANTLGELCYRGDNVFIGYAKSHEDLSTIESIDWLATGDIAECDEAGDYRITGRLKRIAKILGKRINLDEIESYISQRTTIVFAIVSTDEMITLHCEEVNDNAIKMHDKTPSDLAQDIADFCHIHSRYISITYWPVLPRKSNGKIAYMALSNTAAAQP